MSLILKINLVNKNAIVDWSTLQVNQILTKEVDGLNFDIKKTPSKTIPSMGDTVELLEDGTKIFGGILTEIKEIMIGGMLVGYSISCKDYSQTLDQKLVVKSYANQSAKQIILDIIATFTTGFTTANVMDDVTPIGSVRFNYEQVSRALTQLADLIGWDWFVDENKDLHFFPEDKNAAPFSLDDTSGNFEWQTLEFNRNILELKNHIFVRGGEYKSAVSEGNAVDKYSADGTQVSFPLVYRYDSIQVKKNGVAQTIGIDNITDPTTVDCLYNFQEKVVKFRDNNKPANGQEVRIWGNAYIPLIASVRDQVSIQTYGEYQFAIVDKSINSVNEAQLRAKAELYKWNEGAYEGRFKTLKKGMRTGQKITINSTIRGINKSFKINRIVGKARGFDHLEYEVFLLASGEITFTDIMVGLLGAEKKNITIANNEVLQRLELFDENITIVETVTPSKRSGPYTWGPGGSNDIVWDFTTWAEEVGLIGYWNFLELLNNGAKARDASEQRNDGDLINLVIPDDWVEGPRVGSKALQFNGVSKYMRALIANNLPAQQNGITSSCWVYINSLPVGKNYGLVVASGYSHYCWIQPEGKVVYGAWTDYANEQYNSIVSVAVGQWCHIVVVNNFANNLSTVYINGVNAGSNAIIGKSKTIAFFDIGRHVDYNGDYLEGKLDNVRIYNRALSLLEIGFLFNNKI